MSLYFKSIQNIYNNWNNHIGHYILTDHLPSHKGCWKRSPLECQQSDLKITSIFQPLPRMISAKIIRPKNMTNQGFLFLSRPFVKIFCALFEIFSVMLGHFSHGFVIMVGQVNILRHKGQTGHTRGKQEHAHGRKKRKPKAGFILLTKIVKKSWCFSLVPP